MKLGSKKQNADFVETKLTCQPNFIDVQYSAISSLFRFQGDIVEDNCISESMCNVIRTDLPLLHLSFPFCYLLFIPYSYTFSSSPSSLSTLFCLLSFILLQLIFVIHCHFFLLIILLPSPLHSLSFLLVLFFFISVLTFTIAHQGLKGLNGRLILHMAVIYRYSTYFQEKMRSQCPHIARLD
jgi:hypothetical protein